MGRAIWVVVYQGHGAGCCAFHVVPSSNRESGMMNLCYNGKMLNLLTQKTELAVSFNMRIS